jgi:hypothetical protein
MARPTKSLPLKGLPLKGLPLKGLPLKGLPLWPSATFIAEVAALSLFGENEVVTIVLLLPKPLAFLPLMVRHIEC